MFSSCQLGINKDVKYVSERSYCVRGLFKAKEQSKF
jgi:hypothetical protein